MSNPSDEPTKPLPELQPDGTPSDPAVTQPMSAMPTAGEPMVAGHVPLADAHTAPLTPAERTDSEPTRRRGAPWLWAVLLIAVVLIAAITAIVLGLNSSDPTPVVTDSPTPSVTPTPTETVEAPSTPVEESPSSEPEPPPPPAPEPTPPAPDPTVPPPDPTPAPTP